MGRVLLGGVAIVASAGAVLVGLLVSCGALLLATPLGVRVAAAAAQRYVDGLSIASAAGTVLSGVTLEGVRYSSEALDLQLGTVIAVADFDALIAGDIVFERIEARGGRVAISSAPSGAEPSGPPYPVPELPAPPAGFALRDVRLAEIAVSASGTDVVVHRAAASVSGSDISLTALEASALGADLAATAALRLGEDIDGRIEAVVTLPPDNGTDARSAAPHRVELTANVAVLASADPWRVRVEWSRLAAAGLPGGAVTSPRGMLVATLGSAPLAATLAARVEGEALDGGAEIRADLEAPDLEHVRLSSLEVAAFGGTLAASGDVALGPPNGRLSIELASLDPALLEPRLTGEVGGTFDVRFATQPELGVSMTGELRGRVRDRALDGVLDASYAADALEIEKAEITLGESRLSAGGRWTPAGAALDFRAALPELESWYPPASGLLEAAGTLAGDSRNPSVDADVRGENLALEGVPLVLDLLTVAVDGTLESHEVAIDARTRQGTLRVRADQGLRDKQLVGRMLAARVEDSPGGTWSLAAPFDYRVDSAFDSAAAAGSEPAERSGANGALNIGPACFEGADRARVCVAAANERATFDADAVPISLLSAWLPEGVQAAGTAEATGSYSWSHPPSGSLAVKQRSLVLTQSREDHAEPNRSAEITDIEITGTLTDQRLSAELAAIVPRAGGRVDGRLSLEPPVGGGALSATLDAHLADLSAADALLDAVEDLEGTVDVGITAGGTLDVPAIEGEIDVRSLAARVPRLSVDLSDGRLHAAAKGLDALTFDGRLCSRGCVSLDGALSLANGELSRLEASVDGEGFVVASRDDLRAVIAPALGIEGSPEEWRIEGKVDVSDGLLAIDAVPRNAVRPAAETVVHGRAGAGGSDEAADALPLVLDVDTTIDTVRFEGLGVVATVRGMLDVQKPRDGSIDVTGTLALLEGGTFTAYGQQLMLTGGGQLIFTGAPDNPALDLRATREVGEATVGLRITGTALDISSEVFSEPALSESETLARLVTGRSLASGAPTDPQALERAALGLGIRRALPALDRAGERIGLDELGVDAPGETEGALVAGKQLGEDVYLRYKHGLFDDFAGLELVYRLTRHLRLRTETGTSQSIDLVYDSRGGGDLDESGFPAQGSSGGAADVAGAPGAAP